MKTDRAVVMIVDDDESMRRSTRRLIRTYGLAVATFSRQMSSLPLAVFRRRAAWSWTSKCRV